MRNFQGIVSLWTQTYKKVFKSALVYLYTLFYKQHFYKQRQAEIGKKSSKC